VISGDIFQEKNVSYEAGNMVIIPVLGEKYKNKML
jgi:hypothetical protein